jgi:hypothetical protein
MARALGDEQGANLWLERAANEIEGMPLTHVTASVRNEMIPTLLESGQYLEALDAGLRFNEAGAAIWELVGKGELLEAIPHGTPLDSLVSRMSSEGRKTADRFTQVTFTIPSLLYIARWAIWDRERANEAATQIASLCREVAPAAGDSKYWLGAADVFDAIAVNANVNEFFKIAHSYDKTTHQEVRIIGYLAISLTDDLQQAYGAQLACIELLTTWYAPDTITYQRLLLPFFQDYWTSRFDAMRFRFRSHAVVESELKTAATQPEGDRVRCILKAVRPGFQVKGLESAETWLQNASAS